MASETAYSQNGGAGAEVTSYAYRSWYAGTLQPQEVWTTLPTIGTDQNGPGGTGATVYDYLDCSGNLTWEKDERGFITNYQYNWIPGMVLETVQDIDQGTATSLGLSAPWALPATGQDATTDYLYDPGRRVTQILGPAHMVAGQSVRTATWYVYQDITHQLWSASGYATGANWQTCTMFNPVSIEMYDADGNLTDDIQATLGSNVTSNGALSATDSFPQSSYTAWTHYDYGDGTTERYGQLWKAQVYTNIQSSPPTYTETDYGYDSMGRENMVEDSTFTITRTTYNALGLPTGVWVGTNNSGATDGNPGGGGAPNNMVPTTGYIYDEGNANGDGLLTQETDYVDGNSSDNRVTSYLYDWRDRLAYTIEPADAQGRVTYTRDSYDNLGEGTMEQTYLAASGSNVTGAPGPYLNDAPWSGDTLLAQSGASYDNLGQVYQTTTYDVSSGSVVTAGDLVDNYWYDAAGNQIESLPGGTEEFTKSAYDSLGQLTNIYTGYDGNNATRLSYAETSSVTSDDTILEQTDYSYDEAGDVALTTTHQRFHDDTTTTGADGVELAHLLHRRLV